MLRCAVTVSATMTERTAVAKTAAAEAKVILKIKDANAAAMELYPLVYYAHTHITTYF